MESEASENPVRNKRHFTTLNKVLAATSITLFVLSALGFGLFAAELQNYRREKEINHRPSPPGQRPGHGGPSTTTTATPSPTSTPPPNKLPNDAVCLTPECVMAAANLLQSLDTSVDPCDNFYLYANGGWLKQHPVPADAPMFGIAQSIGEETQRIISSILNPSKSPSPSNLIGASSISPLSESALSDVEKRNLDRIRSFHDACMDEETLDAIGTEPLLDLVKEVLGAWREVNATKPKTVEGAGLVMQNSGQGFSWEEKAEEEKDEDPLRKWVCRVFGCDENEDEGGDEGKKAKAPKGLKPRKDRLTNVLLYLHSRDIPAFFTYHIDGDIGKDPSIMHLWLDQAGLGLPGRDYYLIDKDDPEQETLELYTDSISSALKDVYATLAEEAGLSKKAKKSFDADQAAKDVLGFEKKIAEVTWDNVRASDVKATYNPHNASALANLFPSIIWNDYFSGFSPRPRYPDPAIVGQPSFLSDLAKIIEGADEATLEAYFVWHLVLNYGPLLGSRSAERKATSKLSNYLKGIEKGVRPRRANVCQDILLKQLGLLVGGFYIDLAFPERSRKYADTIIAAVIEAFKERLPELDWLDSTTRKTAEEKASAIVRKIGYPLSPDTTDQAALERYFLLNGEIKPDAHFDNVIGARMADQKRLWNKIGKDRDLGEWDMIPSEVNAYYNPAANEIVFPAAILHEAYFNPVWPEYMAFGGFGAVAGHELTHAFDPSGRLYDKNGKLFDWWTNSTSARFAELQKCIIDQYSEYWVEDSKGKKFYVNGNFTTGEDTADAGGIAQAFRAWQDRFGSDRKGEKYDNFLLPGLTFTREQLFFISYARGWARSIKPEEAVRRIREDEHSPTNWRVIGPLSNNLEFQEAFKCKAGDAMVRKNRCKLW